MISLLNNKNIILKEGILKLGINFSWNKEVEIPYWEITKITENYIDYRSISTGKPHVCSVKAFINAIDNFGITIF